MRSFLLNIHSHYYLKNETDVINKKPLIKWLLFNSIVKSIEVFFFYFLKFNLFLGQKPSKITSNINILVSLTSFPDRINNVWMTIDSILRQKLKPQKVVLYLSQDQFPNKLKQMPNNLIIYTKLGLEIEFVKDDIKPHKKYFYASQFRHNYIIVTVDDDLYYKPEMLQSLYKLHNQFPNSVCCNTARIIKMDNNNKILKYNKWNLNKKAISHPTHELIAIGGGGVLYPSNMFEDKNLFDIQMIKKVSLMTDDLWLKSFELINDIPVFTGRHNISYIEIFGSQKFSLKKINTLHSNNNDQSWLKLDKLLNINTILKHHIKQ